MWKVRGALGVHHAVAGLLQMDQERTPQSWQEAAVLATRYAVGNAGRALTPRLVEADTHTSGILQMCI